MIDEMSATRKAEQIAEDDKKEYCTVSLDTADDKKKGLKHFIEGPEISIANSKDAIVVFEAEVEALEDAIKALDKIVAETSENRKDREKSDLTAKIEVLKMTIETQTKEIPAWCRVNPLVTRRLAKTGTRSSS